MKYVHKNITFEMTIRTEINGPNYIPLKLLNIPLSKRKYYF